MPYFESELLCGSVSMSMSMSMSMSPYTQLAYVLPKADLNLLPKRMCDFLLKNYSELYPENVVFKWAFCRYFWECHPVLPEIGMELLDQWNQQFILHSESVVVV